MKHKIILCIFFVLAGNFLFAQNPEKKNSNFHTFLGVDVDNNSIKTNGLYVNGVYKGHGAHKCPAIWFLNPRQHKNLVL